jgi:hypothetical protein
VVFKDAMRRKPIARKVNVPGVAKPVYQSPLSKETETLVLQYLGGKAKEAPKKKLKQKLLLVDSSSDSE